MTDFLAAKSSLFALFLGACAAQPGSLAELQQAGKPTIQKDEMRPLTAPEKALLAKSIANGLKDPGSAQFRWAPIAKQTGPNSTVQYCALVNGKNSYGGYIGFQPFLATVTIKNGQAVSGTLGAVGDGDRRYPDFVGMMCRKEGLDAYAVE